MHHSREVLVERVCQKATLKYTWIICMASSIFGVRYHNKPHARNHESFTLEFRSNRTQHCIEPSTSQYLHRFFKYRFIHYIKPVLIRVWPVALVAVISRWGYSSLSLCLQAVEYLTFSWDPRCESSEYSTSRKASIRPVCTTKLWISVVSWYGRPIWRAHLSTCLPSDFQTKGATSPGFIKRSGSHDSSLNSDACNETSSKFMSISDCNDWSSAKSTSSSKEVGFRRIKLLKMLIEPLVFWGTNRAKPSTLHQSTPLRQAPI